MPGKTGSVTIRKNTMRKLLCASLIGLGLSLSSTAGLAYADEGRVIIGGTNAEVSGGDIDASREINLTLKKNKTPETPNVAGVEFILSQVDGVDVVDDFTWKKIARFYTYDFIKESGRPITQVGKAHTDHAGQAHFSQLRPGLYVLEEKGSASKPKMLMLPMVGVDGKSFDYNGTMVIKNTPGTVPPGITSPETPPVTDGSTSRTALPDTRESTPGATPGAQPETTAPDKEDKRDTQPGTTTPAGQVPLYPNGPVVNTGGFAIPSPTGEGNMSLLTMIILFATVISLAGGVVYRVTTRSEDTE